MQDDIKPVLTDTRIVEIARSLRWQTQYAEIRANALEMGRAIEREMLRVRADREGRQQGTPLRQGFAGVTVWIGDASVTLIETKEGFEASIVDSLDMRYHAARKFLADAQRAKGDGNG